MGRTAEFATSVEIGPSVRHWRIAFVVMHNRARPLQGRKAAATDKLLVDNPIDRYKIGRDTKGLETAPDGSITIVSRAIDRLARMRAIGCPLLTAYSACFCACTNRQKRFGTELGRCLRWSRSSSRRRRMSPYSIGRGSQGSRQNLLRKTGHHPRIKSEGGLFRDHAHWKPHD